MLFTEPLFLFLFLPLLLPLYYVTPPRLRNHVLIAASLVYYLAGEKLFSWGLVLSVLLDYFAARASSSPSCPRSRPSTRSFCRTHSSALKCLRGSTNSSST